MKALILRYWGTYRCNHTNGTPAPLLEDDQTMAPIHLLASEWLDPLASDEFEDRNPADQDYRVERQQDAEEYTKRVMEACESSVPDQLVLPFT
jgi:hypothetical protein